MTPSVLSAGAGLVLSRLLIVSIRRQHGVRWSKPGASLRRDRLSQSPRRVTEAATARYIAPCGPTGRHSTRSPHRAGDEVLEEVDGEERHHRREVEHPR